MMTLFDSLVSAAVSQNQEYPALRTAVEKELLHYDILREMNNAGYLKHLTFIGGTCLRACYGSERLSEDLDFTGGFCFSKSDMTDLGAVLSSAIQTKYGLPVSVAEPQKESGNTETWKIKIITRPERPDFPAQKINIDICLVPSHDRKVSMLKNRYNVDMGTDGLLLYAESMPEILADKLIAFARRPNRVKNRDLWDIHWLSGKNVALPAGLLQQKLADRNIPFPEFRAQYRARIQSITGSQNDFLSEMRRFLTPGSFSVTFTSGLWWQYLLNLLDSFV